MSEIKNFPVYDLLPAGKENAVGPAYLVGVLGLDSSRDLRKEIENERKNGAVILSDQGDGGYFRAKTLDEIKEFVAGREHSIQTTLDSIRAAKKVLEAAERGIARRDAQK